MFHVGDHSSELDMDGVDLETQAQSSTLGTGVGTDHDASSIRPRPAYRWEGDYRWSCSAYNMLMSCRAATGSIPCRQTTSSILCQARSMVGCDTVMGIRDTIERNLP
jgi:hypothetical protein